MRARPKLNGCTLARRHDKRYTTCSAAKGEGRMLRGQCCRQGRVGTGTRPTVQCFSRGLVSPVLAPVNLSGLTT